MKKSERTTRSRIKAVLHGVLWLRSRERAAALKAAHYCCEECGVKQSTAKGREQKIQVHHINGIEWNKIVEYIQRHLLCDPSELEAVCPECHDKLTKMQKEEK